MEQASAEQQYRASGDETSIDRRVITECDQINEQGYSNV